MSELGNKAIMAENIQRLMESRGIDRNKICADLGLKYTTFTDWVKGKTYPRIDKIELMANYFSVPKSHLIESQDTIDLFNTKKAKIATDALVQIATSHEVMGGKELHTKKSAAKILSEALISCLKSNNKNDLIKLAAIFKFTDETKLVSLKRFIIRQYYDVDIDLQFKEYVEKEMKS